MSESMATTLNQHLYAAFCRLKEKSAGAAINAVDLVAFGDEVGIDVSEALARDVIDCWDQDGVCLFGNIK